ncbi:MAG: DNA (cytosine-5-)-methyltransferase [Alphaproteobacteria bacterium]|nr:MAG: DNA (cytosine-5-)-methyltransferase [Alphaproteobacteria bacterium]
MPAENHDLALLTRALEVYDQKFVGSFLNRVTPGCWCRETVNRWVKGRASPKLSAAERRALADLLPKPHAGAKPVFDFIDLFAGIGGLRRSFESVGGRCVFTSEWNKHAVRTYKANYYADPSVHRFNSDIRDITLSGNADVSERAAYGNIDREIPAHDVLLAGFPCQPFSIAGVSKKNALGRAHGFECKTQGTLFFDVARIIAAKKPAAFLLENVKNLKSHDKGRTFKVILETLHELGYWVADVVHEAGKDPKILDASKFVPQHRERIVLVGFRKDLNVHEGFSLRGVSDFFPRKQPRLGDILEPEVDEKYILSQKLWDYLFDYSLKHKSKGSGFGYGLARADGVTRTLSARYYKDGSEILVDRGFDHSKSLHSAKNMKNRPRRLTPRECARLMGYDRSKGAEFRIPVSDTQAYRQFGNSVAVPVFEAVAALMKPRIVRAKARQKLMQPTGRRRGRG